MLQFNVSTHHADAILTFTPESKPKTYFVTTRDNKKIAYWYFPVEKSRGVVILVHGYGNPGGKSAVFGQVEYLQKAGYSTALLDLRSYGESEGQQISMGVHEWKDLEAVYDQMKLLPENNNKKIGFLGISMGAVSSIIEVGQTGKGDFIIASVPYANFDSLFSAQLTREGVSPTLFLPLMKQLAYTEFGTEYQKFTAENYITRVHVPILIIRALHDDVVKSEDAQVLYEAAAQPKTYAEIESRHDIFYFHPDEFKEVVLDFLQKNSN